MPTARSASATAPTPPRTWPAATADAGSQATRQEAVHPPAAGTQIGRASQRFQRSVARRDDCGIFRLAEGSDARGKALGLLRQATADSHRALMAQPGPA